MILTLLVFVPVSLALSAVHASELWVFFTAATAIVPLAELIRRATEQIAARLGSAMGALINVTFGNAAELILALFVLAAGKPAVVQATITGSIIGNSLLGLGLAVLAGSRGRAQQLFKRERAGLLGSLLILAVIALLIPALFDYAERSLGTSHSPDALDERLSIGVSIVLIAVYVGNLFYTLVTHRSVFEHAEPTSRARWTLARALTVLVAATAAVAIEAELVSHGVDAAATGLGISTFFLGVIVLPMIGNAAEYVSAIYFARQDRMGMVMSIAVGSSIQIALMTAPVLVLVSLLLGHPMNLVFGNPLELIAIAGSAFAVNAIATDGETTWFEGLLLVAVYALLALAFFFF